ncbi:MAG TPA: hypothetical protein EYH11_05320 [Sulfurimonas autotrophica]|nr:hypothetical protein [Sulfurimonas autotrophica]
MLFANNNTVSDLCYGAITNDDDKYETTIPIRNTSEDTLMDVQVFIDSFSLFDNFQRCDIFNRNDSHENCKQESDVSFASNLATFGNKGILYNLQSLMSNIVDDEVERLFFESTFSLLNSNDYKLIATYKKNGTGYTGIVPSCTSSTSENETVSTIGSFDAWDTTRDNASIPPSDRNISTKIVNKAFTLSLASLNKKANGYEIKNGSGDINVAIYPKNSTTPISNHVSFNPTANPHTSVASFTVAQAQRDAVVGFQLCATYENNTTTGETLYHLYGSTACSSQTVFNDCNAITSGTPTWHLCYSTDNFAIRPYAFRVFGGDSYNRAGEDFNITIKAVDQINYDKNDSSSYDRVSGASKYNVNFSDLTLTFNFYTPTNDEINIMYNNVTGTKLADINTKRARVANCPHSGTSTKLNPTDSFVDGNLTAKLKFSETGILTITVSETIGHEFAIVDSDDTPKSKRFIQASLVINSKSNISQTSLLLINPYSIDTVAEYNTSTSKEWVYMDDISSTTTNHTKPNMSAYIHYIVTARNKDGAITKNFTSTCFPDTKVSCPRVNGLQLNTTYNLRLTATLNTTADVNLSIYNADKNNNTLFIAPDDQYANLLKGNNTLTKATMYPKQFTDGVAESYVHFNVDKNISVAQNPVTIKVIDTNTSLGWTSSASPAALNGDTLNRSYSFLYARTHTQRQQFIGTDGNTPIFYEVYCSGSDCDKTLLPNGVASKITDDPRWFINTLHNPLADGSVTHVTQKGSASTVITTTLSHTTGKTTASLHYNATKGYPYKTTMEINSAKWLVYNKYNPNATTYEFAVEFISQSSDWAGVRETDTTTNKNASENTNRRLMW